MGELESAIVVCPICEHHHKLIEYMQREPTIPSFQCVHCSIVTKRKNKQTGQQFLGNNHKKAVYFGRIKTFVVKAILAISLLIIFWG